MRYPLPQLLIAIAIVGALTGCSDYRRAERPPWRAQAEEVCLAKGLVQESASLRAAPPMDGPGICGATHPFKVTALDGGSVALNSTQTLDCPMIAALDTWMHEVVQPAAEARFGERVVKVDSMGSYNCRGINNKSGAGLSEHSFANAIDIGGFTLASGRSLNIQHGFNGEDEQERAFLHEVHAGACSFFTTVLGPGYNVFHYNHFHLDLALHGSTSRGPRRYCKPVPQTNLPDPPVKDRMPDPPAIEEEMDIARAPQPEPSYSAGRPRLLASLTPSSPALSPRMPAASSPRIEPAEAPPIMAARAAPRPTPRAEPAEPPLISFGGAPEAAEPAPRPRRSLAYGSAPESRIPRNLNPDQPLLHDEGGERARPTAPRQEGSPQDDDLTSSVAR